MGCFSRGLLPSCWPKVGASFFLSCRPAAGVSPVPKRAGRWSGLPQWAEGCRRKHIQPTPGRQSFAWDRPHRRQDCWVRHPTRRNLSCDHRRASLGIAMMRHYNAPSAMECPVALHMRWPCLWHCTCDGHACGTRDMPASGIRSQLASCAMQEGADRPEHIDITHDANQVTGVGCQHGHCPYFLLQ
jgi:hypothetical protein